MTQVTFNLPAELAERAREAGILTEERMIAMIEAELESEDEDWEEDSTEEILAGFREGWHDAMTGNTRPWREVFDELKETAADDEEG